MKLYYVAQSRATRPRWILEELGVPYEIVRLDPKAGDNRKPEYLAIHPLGHVPALVDDDGTPLFESAALCMHLADKYPEKKLAPGAGTTERGLYYQWVVYGMATLEPALLPLWELSQLPGDQRDPAKLEKARARFHDVARVLERQLTGRPYLLGEQFTAADVVIGTTLAWAQMLKLLDPFLGLQAYVAGVMARPAAQKARAD